MVDILLPFPLVLVLGITIRRESPNVRCHRTGGGAGRMGGEKRGEAGDEAGHGGG